jgi:hypothetical protein
LLLIFVKDHPGSDEQNKLVFSMPKKLGGARQKVYIFITSSKNFIKSATTSPAGTIGSA